MRTLTVAACLLAALTLAATATAGPSLEIGAAEDAPKSADFGTSKAQFELARSARLKVVRITALWQPGMAEPDPETVALYQTTAAAADETRRSVIVAVYAESNRGAPLDEASRAEFAGYIAGLARAVPALRSFIIGNEPNLNRFWLPQYNPDQTSASPRAYVELLAATYDALKAVDPSISVIGGALSPDGTDNPTGKRPSHSPGNFILGMGDAYRAMGRALPLMDKLAFHPYGRKSKTPPTAQNPRTNRIQLADYGKLVAFLGQAFHGTAQPGAELPIIYDEYGVQSVIPKAKRQFYRSHGLPVAADAVPEAVQASYYRQALQIALCQRTVTGLLFFHTVDEPDLRRWQSGLFYPDLQPKASLQPVRKAIRQARRGRLTSCDGNPEPVKPLALELPPGGTVAPDTRRLEIVAGCSADCVFIARLERVTDGSTALAKAGVLTGGSIKKVGIPLRNAAPDFYRVTLRLSHPGNHGAPVLRASEPLQVVGSS